MWLYVSEKLLSLEGHLERNREESCTSRLEISFFSWLKKQLSLEEPLAALQSPSTELR